MLLENWLRAFASRVRRLKNPRPRQDFKRRQSESPSAVEHLENRLLLTIDFDFVYAGSIGSGDGFEDSARGQARRDALELAGTQLGSIFDHTATITLSVTSTDDAMSDVLASAGSEFNAVPLNGFNGNEVVRHKILVGPDLNGADADGTVDVNWGQPWELSADPADVDATEYDFVSTMYHELLHAVGWLSVPSEAGLDLNDNSPVGQAGAWSFFDKFITDMNGNPIIHPQTHALDLTTWDANKAGGASPGAGLYFSGANARAANGGDRVGLYTPTTFSSGSSVSHLDDDNPALGSLMMASATDFGPGARNLTTLERAVLADVGYRFLDGGITVTESGGSTSVLESVGTDTFQVVLTTQPLANVIINVSTDKSSEATVNSAGLTFTPVNWNVPQTITVSGVDDALMDGNQTTIITLSVVDAGSDDGYDTTADATVTVTTIDDDAPTRPSILTPSGTIDIDAVIDGSVPNVEFSWEAVDTAVSYDLWVSSLDSFEQIVLKEGVVGNRTFIPITELSQGKIRIWARANLANATQSAWSIGKTVELNVTPTVTGPALNSPRHLTADTTPVIEWASATGVQQFQIWLTHMTTGAVQRFNVDNLTPLLDANGDPVLDFAGRPFPQEIRAFEVPTALDIGRYSAWVRTIDVDGNPSSWSDAYRFDVGPRPQNLSPGDPSFFPAPLLRWDAVAGATEYEVFVATKAAANTPLYRETVVTNSFQIPADLPDGDYVFWVRAIIRGDGIPTVVGVWSEASHFRTLVPPVITGPVANQGFVTAKRPTIEWTAIHGAATYDVLVHKRGSRPPFLEARSNPTSMTFTQDLAAGTYTVWVRAIDTRGRLGPWSDPFFFTATGGITVITSPANGATGVFFPKIDWVAVDGAVSYDVWITRLGFPFTVTNTPVNGTTYSPPGPFSGSYRVWVRAVFADGTMSAWSAPVNLTASVDKLPSENETQLVNLDLNITPDMAPNRTPDDSVPGQVYEAAVEPVAERPTADAHTVHTAPATTDGENSNLPADVLAELAKRCVEAEWWAIADEST